MSSKNGRPGRNDGIVIVGGGLAGQRCVETLRRQGYEGAIRIVCAEDRRPYDRPPLSKELLAGSRLEESIAFRSAAWYEEQEIDLLLGASAIGVELAERRVRLSDGTELRSEWLLIATGSRPRSLPALEHYDNVSFLRTLDDSIELREVLVARPRLAVIGAGFIGQEIAATARMLGATVTMIEAAPCPLAGVLGPRWGAWFADLHRAEGVDVRTGCTIEQVEGNGRVQGLRLSDGTFIEADHVVVGIGVEPDVGWLSDSGLAVAGAVRVDQHGRSAIERVLAAGDAAATFDPLVRRHVAGSHWEAAARQGARAARVMLGLDPGDPPLSSFWTDQYGIRIQYLGQARLADSVQLDGAPESRSFNATFTRAGRPVAALLVDRPRLLPAVRKLIEKGAP
jgi:NADPH-dependent 2,4-dienoyl-CoA reductase/sulfur reductase-like enzyme